MILVLGEILFDVYEDHKRIGGAPFNFACHLRRLGFPVRLITRIGNDAYGREIADILHGLGFDPNDLQVDDAHATGVVQVVLDSGGVPRFDIRPDAAYDYLDLKLDLDRVSAPDRAQIDLVYFGTLIQRTARGFERTREFLAQAGPGTLRFCDLNLRPPYIFPEVVAASLRLADILKLNRDEFEYVLAQCAKEGAPIEAEAWLMRHFGIDTLALTDGARGSRVFRDDQVVTAPSPQTAVVVDTVGAGDAYAAILAAGILKGLPMARTVALAGEFAARVCAISGAIPDDMSLYPALV
jgi:fructokinase